MNDKLGRDDWIMAAFRALVSGGPQAIRIEAIARAINVSKGSFYWHFKNLNDLKSSMLEHWQQIATEGIITEVENHQISAVEKLKLLVDITTSMNIEAYGGLLAEPAIRDWARYDEKAADSLTKVDQKRLDYLSELFQETGQSISQSTSSSKLLYAGLIGLNHLSHQKLADQNIELKQLLRLLLLPEH